MTFAKSLLGKSDVEAVLQRLDRLTTEESRMTATQTMEVVYGLFKNLKAVMDGTEMLLVVFFVPCLLLILLDGESSLANIRAALGMINSDI